MAGGMWRKSMVFDWRVRIARRFLPIKIVSPQPENRCSSDTSRMLFATFAASDHLWTYSLHNLRRSSRPQGLWGFSIKPAAKSSRRHWSSGELRARSQNR